MLFEHETTLNKFQRAMSAHALFVCSFVCFHIPKSVCFNLPQGLPLRFVVYCCVGVVFED